jgi:flagellar motor protein MotB
MKFMIGSAALLLILSTPAFAQEEPKPQQQEEHKPQDSPKAPAQEKAPPAKPAEGQPKEKQAPPEKPAQPPPKAQNQDKQQQNEKKAQEKQTQQQTKEQQAQPKQAQAQNHNAPAQNGGNARRIPDDKFRAHFGPQHHFRVARGGGNRFQYGGYWFAYNEPWPVGWSYDDDCYIEDDGGVYYLIDVLHPDVRLVVAVEVS